MCKVIKYLWFHLRQSGTVHYTMEVKNSFKPTFHSNYIEKALIVYDKKVDQKEYKV